MIALSWSRLSTYMQCPRKFKLSYIDKVFKEDEKSIHLIKGEQLHKQMEEYVEAISGRGTMPLGFSPEVKGALPYVDRIKDTYASLHAEAQIAADIKWQPTEWFGRDTAWRAIWDCTALRPDTCLILDWKSGKVYPYDQRNADGSFKFGQLHLSALMGLHRWPALGMIDTAYVYLEHKVIQRIRVSREPGQVDAKGEAVPHMAETQLYFDQQFERVQMEKAWAPQANENCKWCPATKAQCPMSRKL